jgi:hypothetical protein
MNVTLHKKDKVKLLAGHHERLMIDDKKSAKDSMPKLHSIEAIHHRAETVTPCLKGILDFRPNPMWRH